MKIKIDRVGGKRGSGREEQDMCVKERERRGKG